MCFTWVKDVFLLQKCCTAQIMGDKQSATAQNLGKQPVTLRVAQIQGQHQRISASLNFGP